MSIATDFDVTRAALQARRYCLDQGFEPTKVALVVTAVSELGTNILKYAGSGELEVQVIKSDGRIGLLVQASDRGPGIPDIDDAMKDHHSTGGTLGLGLPGVRRMMDEFAIQSQPGQGTRVTVTKWK